jgi:hypothetical protein
MLYDEMLLIESELRPAFRVAVAATVAYVLTRSKDNGDEKGSIHITW